MHSLIHPKPPTIYSLRPPLRPVVPVGVWLPVRQRRPRPLPISDVSFLREGGR